MATAVISLRDAEDGENVDISVDFDPPVSAEGTESSAQLFAFQMLDAIATPDDVVNREYAPKQLTLQE